MGKPKSMPTVADHVMIQASKVYGEVSLHVRGSSEVVYLTADEADAVAEKLMRAASMLRATK